MKRSIVLAMLMILANASFSQQLNPSPSLTAEQYLQKSKGQKTIMNAIAIPGGVLLGIGLLMYMSEFEKGLSPGGDSNEKKSKAADALMIAGGCLMITSIPFAYAARKNEKRALSMGLKSESFQQLQKNGFIAKSIPSLVLRISL